MAYTTKQQDHEKRKNQEGSYSVYNHMYRYLMANYDPVQLDSKPSIVLESVEKQLVMEGIEYNLEGGVKMDKDELRHLASDAITNFINNDGQRGDTAKNLGKRQENSFKNIARSISDLRW